MNNLDGKIALVTGASKGIGASIARDLAAAGATVIVNYSTSKAGAEKTVAQIAAAGGSAKTVQGDVSNPDEIARIFKAIKSEYGKLDILVNNAGVYAFGPLDDVTPEEFHRQFNLNVLGLLLTTKEAVRLMGPQGGSVINISSVVSSMAPAYGSVYSGTKGAVDSITMALSKELGSRQIRVNSINPGLVETEGTHSVGAMQGDFYEDRVKTTPLGRIGQPQDISRIAVFLASNDSYWVNGQAILAAGGGTV